MIRRILIFIAILVLILPMLLLGLLNTESGSRWVIENLFAVIPGQSSTVKTIEGRILDHLVLTEIKIKHEAANVSIQTFEWTWQPSRLLSKTLKIDDISVTGMDIQLNETKPDTQKSEPLDLDIKLPFQIDVGNFIITDSSVTRNNATTRIDRLQLQAKTVENQLKLATLMFKSDKIEVNAQGDATITKKLPLNLTIDWKADLENNGIWQGSTSLGGDLIALNFANRLSSPFKLSFQGAITDAADNPRIKADGDWESVKWPIVVAPPQIQSPKGHFELSGMPNDYQVKLNAELSQQYLPQTRLFFDGKGSLDALTIDTLEMKSATGLFNLNGKVSWRTIPEFDITATGDKFNPAIIIPELPGSLKLDCRLKGKLDPKALQISAEINKLSGQLRKQPLDAMGRFRLNGEQLDVDAFNAALGTNKIEAEGELGQASNNLKFSLNMPALNRLWPGLGGQLTGDGRLQGSFKNPSAQVKIQGQRLQFNNFKLQSAVIDVDYYSDDQKTSSLNIVGNDIESGTLTLAKFSLQGNGTSKQHRFNADLVAPHGTVSTALAGQLLANGWKGDLNRLDITDPDKNRWSLQKNVRLTVDKKATSYDLAFDKFCLTHKDAYLCSQGAYGANSDLNALVEIKALPTLLFKPLLPKSIVFTSLIDANAKIQRNNNKLNGDYRLTLSPAKLTVASNGTERNIQIGRSLLSGTLKGERVSSDLTLNLTGNDALQASVLFDTGGAKSLSGKIEASITNFSPIQPFASPLSDLKGRLQADLKLQGSLLKPGIAGRIDLTEGTVNVSEPGSATLGLRSIDLHAYATGRSDNRIQLTGSVVPVILNKPETPEKINLKSLINLDADLSWANVLAGNVKLSIPANTTLLVRTDGAENKVVLGASTLNGRIADKQINADVDIALSGHDFVRGQLKMDTGPASTLSGQFNASIRELAWAEMLAPQLSNVKGVINADMAISGTTASPLMNGGIKLNGGEIDVNDYGLSIREINLNAATSPDNGRLIQLKGAAKSGEGTVNLDGKINLESGLDTPIDLTLTGKNFEVAKIPEAQIAVSPDLTFTLNNTTKLIGGELAIPKAILQLNELPEAAVKVSEDEIIVGEEKPENSLPTAPGIDANIEIKLGKDVSFKGLGLKTGLSGSLKVIKTGEKTVMQGNVDMEKGTYKRFGQDLTLRKGQLVFNGPADNPWLDVEAIRVSKSKKVTAILNLSGTLKSPQTRISADPAMPESEALAYLVTGSPLNQVSSSEGSMLASAALSYGAGQASWLTEKFGLNEFEVQEGDTLKDTLLVMGQYLTPDFYIGTKIGMFNKQANLVLKHKLTDTINVETQTGTSQRIKLNYEFDRD